jgi:hypothetical protein
VTTVAPGQKATLRAGGVTALAPFRVNVSTLEVITSPNVLALVLMPDGNRVAGFVAPAIEINQVFGSLTATATDGARTVEVPAGDRGPFTLMLVARTDGPFTVGITGRFGETVVYRHEVTGTLRSGERIALTLDQAVAAESAGPQAARVVGVRVGPAGPWRGPHPGRILVAPSEMAAASRAR